MACNLNTSPGVNNIEKCGGLPEEIHNAACHMLESGGVSGRQEAIAAAVNFVKGVCATGQSKNFRKGNPNHHVAPEKVARACANVAKWKALNACQRSVSRKGMMPPMTSTEARFILNTVPDDAKASKGEDGVLHVRGVASDIGVDRDGEAFLPGALDKGLKAFMESGGLLLHHHHPDRPLGRVTNYEIADNGDVIIDADVLPPPEGGEAWHREAYDSIASGVTKGFSVGGVRREGGLQIGGGFKRMMTPDGPRIYEADVQEMSITPLPVNPRSFFAVQVEGATKAMEVVDANIWPEDQELEELERMVKALSDVFDTLDAAADRLGSGSTNGI